MSGRRTPPPPPVQHTDGVPAHSTFSPVIPSGKRAHGASPRPSAIAPGAQPLFAEQHEPPRPAALSMRQSMAMMLASQPGRLSTMALGHHHHHHQSHPNTDRETSLSPFAASANSGVAAVVVAAGVDEFVVAGGGCNSDSSAAASPSAAAIANAPHGGGALAVLEPTLATTMPRGRHVLFNMLSTWGDEFEIGLAGIEIFDDSGARVAPASTASLRTNRFTIIADNLPPSTGGIAGAAVAGRSPSPGSAFSPSPLPGVLAPDDLGGSPGVANNNNPSFLSQLGGTPADPRRAVGNVVNGVTNTRDETQMYLTPYAPGGHHLICLVFQHPVTIAMVRVFNYNGGGRVHTAKGVRALEMTVDDAVVFRGEVREATGETFPSLEEQRLGGGCETILFTEDPAILTRIVEPPHQQQQHAGDEPPTSTVEITPPSSQSAAAAVLPPILTFSVPVGGLTPTAAEPAGATPPPPPHPPVALPSECPRGVRSVCLMFLSTWGDEQFIGLGGLRFLSPSGEAIFAVERVQVERPSGKRDAFDGEVAALFDDDVATACAWRFEPGLQLVVGFSHPVDLGFVEVCNYSVGRRRTHCGAKAVRMFLSSAHAESGDALALLYASRWDEGDVGSGGSAAAANRANNKQQRNGKDDDDDDVLPLSAYGRAATSAPPSSSSSVVVEVTPQEGVVLRKAPALLRAQRFQSFDLSLASTAGVGGGAAAACTASMTASMVVRATVALRRARMSAQFPSAMPEWLAAVQSAPTPLLPVAYVWKVTLVLAARGGGSGGGGGVAAALKQLLRAWVRQPRESCLLITDDLKPCDIPLECEVAVLRGDITTGSLGSDDDNGDDDDDGASAAAATGGEEKHHSLALTLSLAFIADVPFALAAVRLRAPMATPPAAWVRSVAVSADDVAVFKSEEAADAAEATQQLQPAVFFTYDDRVLPVAGYR